MSRLVPSGWHTFQLDEICDIVGGGTPDRSNQEYWGGDIPWVSPSEITALSGRYISTTKERITDLGLAKSSAKLNPVGTVLMTSRASIGLAAINTVPVATNQGFQSFRCKEKIYNEYLYQLILWSRRDLERLAAGSTFLEISSTNVKSMQVVIPPIKEQQKIASTLTAVDEVIESTTAQINKLKDLKTGMMQELLTKGIGHTEFKDSPVGRIPTAWDVVRVGEVSKVIDSLHKTPIFCEQGWPMVRVTEIRQSNRLDMSKAAFVDEETFINFSKNYQPQIGDILVARVGAYFGSTTYIDKEMTFCLGQNTAAVRPTGVHPEYLFSFFNSQVGRTQIDESVAGSGQPSFSLKAIKELVLALPSLDEQRKISDVIDSLAQRVRAKERQFALYLDIKKSLMQDLLTGKIRV